MEPKTREPLPTAAETARLPPDGGPEFNRLVHERSPYLRQHARNPVDWYPWGEEAFARARRENKPVFLSVGYSSCHWCHVMEHESFERDDVAAILNRHFIAIKVDREERPDIDDIYMTATQLMTGRGGWPNSVWLMPDGRPWYAGTYFPREDRHGQPGFKTMLLRLADIWADQHGAVEEQAVRLADAVRQHALPVQRPDAGPLEGIVSNAIAALAANYDVRHGGFGGAPKFPPHASLELLLFASGRPPAPDVRSMITGTLDAMMLGGIHDHIGGGFHRYATDDRWFLPHFEKMLYDNAQLAAIYAKAFALTSNEQYRATAAGICDWVLREMTGPEGGFYSALDADSEGVEGRYYVWTRDEILQVLGDADGGLFCHAYHVEAGGNYHEEATGEATGRNIPFLQKAVGKEAERLAACRAKLRGVRDHRVRPGLDDKILTAWNGLMISGLAAAGTALGEPRYVEAAKRCARFLLETMYKDGRLLRSYRAGRAAVDGYLDDHAFLADGLLDLAAATGDPAWEKAARRLADDLVTQFHDGENGGFFTTSSRHEKLLARIKDAFDQAAPSGNAVAARVLLRLAGDGNEFRALAEKTLRCNADMMRRAPAGTSALVTSLAMLLATRPAATATRADATADADHIRAELFLESTNAMPDSIVTGRIALVVAETFHINASPAADDKLLPTEVTLEDEGAFDLLPVSYPEGGAGRVYRGRVEIPVALRVRSEARTGPAAATIVVRAQPCDDRACLRLATLRLRTTLAIAAGDRVPPP